MKSLKKKPPSGARILAPYFPPKTHQITVITDQEAINGYLENVSLICWGQDHIGDTGYFKLAQYRDEHARRNTVVVCKSSLIPK